MGEGGIPFLRLQLGQNEVTGWCTVREWVHRNTSPRFFFFSTFGKRLNFRQTKLECYLQEGSKRAAAFSVCFPGNRCED